MAKVVARRTRLSRGTVYRYLEEACCEDPSAPFITLDNPNGGGLLIMFNPHNRHYAAGEGGDHA